MTVQALKNFDDWEVGMVRSLLMSERVARLIVGDYLRLLWDEAWPR